MLSELLTRRLASIDSLYILGDLFDYWIGDDAVDLLGHRSVVNLIRTIADHGIPVFVMHGNRDFLIGEQFCEMTNATLLTDPCVIEINDHPVILCHGDHLCSDDVDHQKFRQQVRQPEWQQKIMQQTPEQRLQFAKSVRAQSDVAKTGKADEIMDVSDSTVIEEFKRLGASIMIHGHTHRPAIHRQVIDEQEYLRVVLGDWRDSPSFLMLSESELKLVAGSGRPDSTIDWPYAKTS